MTIATDHAKITGETVRETVARLSKTRGVEFVAQYIGYATATDLRRYLKSRGIQDPWSSAKTRGRAHPIPENVLHEYAARRKMGQEWKEAAIGLGFTHNAILRKCNREGII